MSLPPDTVRALIARTVEYGFALVAVEVERERRRTIVRERVTGFLAANPGASKNAVYEAVGRGFDKRLTLDAVDALRSARTSETADDPSAHEPTRFSGCNRPRAISPEEWLAGLYAEAAS